MSKFKEKIMLLFAIIFTASVMIACSNDNKIILPKEENKPQSDDFCEYVSEEKLELTGEFINDFLKELDTNLTDTAKLEKLCNWLKEKDCVIDAEILSVSTIKTLPAQSEILVTFATYSGSKKIVIDIVMSEPLKFGRICSEIF